MCYHSWCVLCNLEVRMKFEIEFKSGVVFAEVLLDGTLVGLVEHERGVVRGKPWLALTVGADGGPLGHFKSADDAKWALAREAVSNRQRDAILAHLGT